MAEIGAKPKVPRLHGGRYMRQLIGAANINGSLPYNTGPFSKQWGGVQRTILRLAFPGGKPRPKPGAWAGETFISPGERDLAVAAQAAREAQAAAAVAD